MAVVLEACNLSWHHAGRAIIDDISFNLPPGKMLALLGPNGAGKSTLLRCLSGYYQPSQGQVLLNGQLVDDIGARARLVAYLPQKAPALMSMSVYQAIMLGRRPYLAFRPSRQDIKVVEEKLELMGLSALAHKPVQLISAGEYQRVLLARVLSQQTPVLLLDEPLNNLDPAHQLHLLALLQNLAANEGKTIVMSMHDINLSSRFCALSMLLANGRCLAGGLTAQVLSLENLSRAFAINMQTLQTPEGIRLYYSA